MLGMSEDDLGIVDALAQLTFLVQGTLARRAAEYELSIIQMRLLGVLRDRTPAMNDLAKILELDKSSLTGLVDRAERRGLATLLGDISEAERSHLSGLASRVVVNYARSHGVDDLRTQS
jgi:DNA-binding MarR family transcriptional regulator